MNDKDHDGWRRTQRHYNANRFINPSERSPRLDSRSCDVPLCLILLFYFSFPFSFSFGSSCLALGLNLYSPVETARSSSTSLSTATAASSPAAIAPSHSQRSQPEAVPPQEVGLAPFPDPPHEQLTCPRPKPLPIRAGQCSPLLQV